MQKTPRTGTVHSRPELQRISTLEDTAARAAEDPRELSGNQIIQLQRAIGNRAVNRLIASAPAGQPAVIQRKLSVGAADDPFEREADRVAAGVLSSQTEANRRGWPTDEQTLQTKPAASSAAFEVGDDFQQRLNANGSGQPLAADTRAYMEDRIGADFSRVRLHTGAESEQLNREVDAQAFTHRRDIYLGERAPDMASGAGKQLLAHELTHTLQQGGVQRLRRHPNGRSLTRVKEQRIEIDRKLRAARDGDDRYIAPASVDQNNLGLPAWEEVDVREDVASIRAGPKGSSAEPIGAQKDAPRKMPQKISPGAIGLAAAGAILRRSYSRVRKIAPGTVVILGSQQACANRFDAACIAAGVIRPDGTPWQSGDCDRDDGVTGVVTQGFAWDGVVYVSAESMVVPVTQHEMLHTNAASGFQGKVGGILNEGISEMLTLMSLRQAGIRMPGTTAYPLEVRIASLVAGKLGIDVIKRAYFEDAEVMVKAYLKKVPSTWEELVAATRTRDSAKVRNVLKM
ncbi:MAG: DUF4157 domain-containing protein [Thermoflexales bacterium]